MIGGRLSVSIRYSLSVSDLQEKNATLVARNVKQVMIAKPKRSLH